MKESFSNLSMIFFNSQHQKLDKREILYCFNIMIIPGDAVDVK